MDVQWLHRTTTPGYAYALNRYLSLVLEHLLAALPHGQSRVWPDHEIIRMTPVGHACHDPALCPGQEHDRVISDPKGVETSLDGVDLVIVRHGAKPQRLPTGPAVRGQMTPFDFPL